MLSQLRTLPSLKGQDRGFTLIELLIVVLIVGILAAVGVPLYLGYVRDAKAVEGKSHVGSIWTSMQSIGVANCGVAVPLASSFGKAGLTPGGVTADGRWTAAGAGTLTVACATGLYTVAGGPAIFTLTGTAADVAPILITMNYTVGASPPGTLTCVLVAGAAPAAC